MKLEVVEVVIKCGVCGTWSLHRVDKPLIQTFCGHYTITKIEATAEATTTFHEVRAYGGDRYTHYCSCGEFFTNATDAQKHNGRE